jgi:23S rRNA (guanosine2251-2'-O)-methyltransferase
VEHIYGVMPVMEALKAGSRAIDRLIIASGARPARLRELIEAARRAGIPVIRQPRAHLDRITGNANHQGVVAVAAAARYADLDQLLSNITPETILVLLDGIEDPRNLGAIIRAAECAGAGGVIIPERRSARLSQAAVKASAGAVEHIPVARARNMASLIEELKGRGVCVVGVQHPAEIPYTEYDYSGPLALVFGGEGRGLSRLVREKCDVVVYIPMRGKVASLNVSVAAGIVLFEAVRRHSALHHP